MVFQLHSQNLSKTTHYSGKYGRLESVWVAQNPPGFAFVQYEHFDDASKAVKDLNGTSPFDDAKIRVEHSRDRNSRGRGGSYGGGRSFGRRGGSGGFRGEGCFCDSIFKFIHSQLRL